MLHIFILLLLLPEDNARNPYLQECYNKHMLIAILVILFLLWFLGYGPLQTLSINLFNINGRVITLWDILIFIVLIWLVDALPGPLRPIAAIIFAVWIFASLGFIAIPALSSLLIVSTIVGLLLYIVSSK